jgi:hypothetical protein
VHRKGIHSLVSIHRQTNNEGSLLTALLHGFKLAADFAAGVIHCVDVEVNSAVHASLKETSNRGELDRGTEVAADVLIVVSENRREDSLEHATRLHGSSVVDMHRRGFD